jgi:hypothetical protein
MNNNSNPEPNVAEIEVLTQLSRSANQTLRATFFSQLELLRQSCNDFEGLQKNITALLQQDYEEKKDLVELITLLEYLTPSYSLDFLTIIIIAA